MTHKHLAEGRYAQKHLQHPISMNGKGRSKKGEMGNERDWVNDLQCRQAGRQTGGQIWLVHSAGLKNGPRSAPCAGSADVAGLLILTLYFLDMR